MLKCQQPAIEAGVYGVRGVESWALGAHQAIGTGRQGRHVKGFSGETSPSVVSKYQGGGDVSVICAFAVGERFPGVSRFGALPRPLRGA